MLTVSLRGIRFYASVGIYPEESFLDNEIEVDISVTQAAPIDDLPFIDYSILYDMVKTAITGHTGLLETIVQRIVKDVQQQYPEVEIKISIRKLHPPLGGQVASSEVSWASPAGNVIS